MLNSLLRVLLAVPGLYPLLAFLAARRVVVRGWSMHPTLQPGEHVLFDRLAYRKRQPRRGDVVLAVHPARPGTKMVKRVAGVPGDRMAVDGERWWVNGAPLGGTEGGQPESARRWTLGEDEWLLLGDAPQMSTDSRELGPVRTADIQARAWLVYWPRARARRLGSDGGQ